MPCPSTPLVWKAQMMRTSQVRAFLRVQNAEDVWRHSSVQLGLNQNSITIAINCWHVYHWYHCYYYCGYHSHGEFQYYCC